MVSIFTLLILTQESGEIQKSMRKINKTEMERREKCYLEYNTWLLWLLGIVFMKYMITTSKLHKIMLIFLKRKKTEQIYNNNIFSFRFHINLKMIKHD